MIRILLQAANGGGGGGMSMLIMMVLLFAIMWFFMIRPQTKKQKEIRQFQNALQVGTKVVIGGGIYGVVKNISIETGKIGVEIAKGVVVEVDRNYVYADANAANPAAK